MATIVLNIPDSQLSRVVDAIALHEGYQPGTETKNQFAKRMLIQQVKNWIKRIEGEAAAASARKTATDNVETINIT